MPVSVSTPWSRHWPLSLQATLIRCAWLTYEFLVTREFDGSLNRDTCTTFQASARCRHAPGHLGLRVQVVRLYSEPTTGPRARRARQGSRFGGALTSRQRCEGAQRRAHTTSPGHSTWPSRSRWNEFLLTFFKVKTSPIAFLKVQVKIQSVPHWLRDWSTSPLFSICMQSCQCQLETGCCRSLTQAEWQRRPTPALRRSKRRPAVVRRSAVIWSMSSR